MDAGSSTTPAPPAPVGRAAAGFTLIELMIVVAIIAIIAAIAIPNLMGARKTANEKAAIATLRNLMTAQAQLQARIAIDVDMNGAGEYGFFGELSGSVGIREASGAPGTDIVRPSILSAAFSKLRPGGIAGGGLVTRAGYYFQMFLPDGGGTAVAESPTGGVGATAPDPQMSTSFWCAYAWPSTEVTGQRCFFANQSGDILAARNSVPRYAGTTNPPPVNAAFSAASSGRLSSTLAANTTGLDGQRWNVVQ